MGSFTPRGYVYILSAVTVCGVCEEVRRYGYRGIYVWKTMVDRHGTTGATRKG